MNKVLSLVKPLVEKFPRVSSIYRKMRDELLFLEEPAITPWGFKLAGNPSMASGTFEPEETKLIRELLSGVDVLVNVGANIGYYCCHALSMGKEVIAFEPMQSNIRYLCKNIDANEWSCEIFPLALSNESGILKIFGGGTGASLVRGWAGASENYFTFVPCSTMDRIIGTRLEGKKVLFVIDVEGAEHWVLEGSSKILKNTTSAVWLIEIHSSQQQPNGISVNPRFSDTFKLMFASGYTARTADSLGSNVTLEDLIAVQNGQPTAISSIHNFIFSKPEE